MARSVASLVAGRAAIARPRLIRARAAEAIGRASRTDFHKICHPLNGTWQIFFDIFIAQGEDILVLAAAPHGIDMVPVSATVFVDFQGKIFNWDRVFFHDPAFKKTIQ